MKLPEVDKQPILHIDMTPSEDLPIRILEAYLSNACSKWIVHGLPEEREPVYQMMNDHQDQRAEILEDAVECLREARRFAKRAAKAEAADAGEPEGGVEMPKTQLKLETCPDCGGYGVVGNGPDQGDVAECSTCKGSGQLYADDEQRYPRGEEPE